jgi:hypothetical protein
MYPGLDTQRGAGAGAKFDEAFGVALAGLYRLLGDFLPTTRADPL